MEERESKAPEWLKHTGKFTDKQHDGRCVRIKNGKRKYVKEPVIVFGFTETKELEELL